MVLHLNIWEINLLNAPASMAVRINGLNHKELKQLDCSDCELFTS